MGKAHRFYEDHGNAYRSDGPSQSYAPGPTLQVIPTASIAGQFIHRCMTEAETARIALERIEYAHSRAVAFNAQDDQLQGVVDACRDVEMALAKVIAQLTRGVA